MIILISTINKCYTFYWIILLIYQLAFDYLLISIVIAELLYLANNNLN